MKQDRRTPSVIEKYLLANPTWQEGFRQYRRLLGRPGAWIVLIRSHHQEIFPLDRKGEASLRKKSSVSESLSRQFHAKYAGQLIRDEERLQETPLLYKDAQGRRGAIFVLRHLQRIKSLLFLTGFSQPEKSIQTYLHLFEPFLTSQVDLAFKTFELNNFYETVHPRALALSTMHSVHRVISSSLRLKELLPRIGRLSAQVLKAKGCAIMLMDQEHHYLLPYFAFGENRRFVHRHRIRVGRGLQGRVAASGEFHLSHGSVAVPFIEDDVVGIITLWDKIDKQPFTKIDLEILKSLSEQAVVAIKNAQLFEQTEKLTLGSIKAISELLELKFKGDRHHLPLFAEIVTEVGKELGLSSREQIHLERAIMLLDTGTLALPEQVWQKKGKLTKKEYAMMKRVPMRGATLLKSISSLRPVIPIVQHHHERFDGKGYPQGLKGEEIPIGARIVSVVNSFVAMISKRSYREKMSVKRAIAEMRSNQGTQFDPKVVAAFIKVLQREEVLNKIISIQAGKGKVPASV